MTVARPSPTPIAQPFRAEAEDSSSVREEISVAQERDTQPISSSPPILFRQNGRLQSLLHSVGFEELLLLGLILLLAGSEEYSDTVLWLVLLLFCG